MQHTVVINPRQLVAGRDDAQGAIMLSATDATGDTVVIFMTPAAALQTADNLRTAVNKPKLVSLDKEQVDGSGS